LIGILDDSMVISDHQESGLSAVNRRAGFTAAPNSRNALAPINSG
jgi:hypothetical protein